jgi:hypothetical protein
MTTRRDDRRTIDHVDVHSLGRGEPIKGRYAMHW